MKLTALAVGRSSINAKLNSNSPQKNATVTTQECTLENAGHMYPCAPSDEAHACRSHDPATPDRRKRQFIQYDNLMRQCGRVMTIAGAGSNRMIPMILDLRVALLRAGLPT